MRHPRPAIVLLASAFLLSPAAPAQAQPQAAPANAAPAEPPAKAARYHAALLRKPEPGLIFDRFCDAWLTELDADSLEAFLAQRAATGSTDDRLVLGFFFAREGRNVEAIRVFRETLAQEPERAAAHYFKARTEAATLDFDTALADLETAANAADTDPALAIDVAKLRGQLLARTGEPEEAQKVWDALLDSDAADTETFESLVTLQAREGLYEAALATLERLIGATSDPQKKVARRLWRGDLQQDAGDNDAALLTYEAVLADVAAGDWLERQVLGQIEQTHRRKQDTAGFAERLATLEKAHPERTELTRRRARVLAELGRSEDSLEAWRSLLERTPGDRALRGAYAAALAEAGKTDEAIGVVEALRDDRPGDGETRLRLAELYAQAERLDDAEAEVTAFVEGSDGSAAEVTRAVRTLERLAKNGSQEPNGSQGLGAAAERLARSLAQERADEPGVKEALAELLHRRGKTDEALAIFKEIGEAAEDPTSVVAAARAMATRAATEPALALLLQREGDFPDHPQRPELLAALADTALRAGNAEAAVPFLRGWVAGLDDVTPLSRAVDLSARLARSAEAGASLIEDLGSSADPKTPGEAWLLAALHEQAGDSPAADAALAGGAADGEQASDLLVRARVDLWRRRGEPRRAAEALAALAERPGAGRSDLLRELIDLHQRADQPDEALAAVDRWKETSPGSVAPWLKQAALLTESGRDQEAVKVLASAARRFPEDVAAATQLARAHAARGEVAEAARVYWRLYDQAESAQSKVSWATQLAELTRWTDQGRRVIEQLEERRDAAPNEVAAHLALAEAYRVLDRYEDRRQALTEAARVQPDDVNLLLALAQTDEANGDLEGSAETLRRALPLDASGRIRQRLAALYVELGEPDRGFALLEAAVDPADADAVLAFANALIADARWEEAAAWLGSQADRFADDYRVGYVRGVALTESYNDDGPAAAEAVFLGVLDATEEPPGVTAPAEAAQMRGWLGSMREILPAGSLDLMQQMIFLQQAQTHRLRAMHGGGGSVTVTPPASLEAAHGLAVAQLRTLGQEFDPPQRAELEAALIARRVPKAELLMALPADAMRGFEVSPEVTDAFQEDRDLLGMQLLVNGFGDGELPPERVDAAVNLFADDFPVLSLLARLGRFTRLQREGAPEGDLSTEWATIRGQLEGMDQAPDPVVMMLAQQLSGFGGPQGMADGLDDGRKKDLLARLSGWYGGMDASNQMKPFLLAMLGGAMSEAEDWAGLGRLLTDETLAAAGRGNAAGAAAQRQMAAMMQQNQGVLQPLSFPPVGLSSVPSSVLQMLGADGPFGQPQTIDPEAMLAALPEDAPPALRALIAGFAGDGEALTAALAPLLDAEPPSLDALVLSASWLAEAGEPLAALDPLIKATYLPMNRSERTRLDGAIVSAALETPDELSDTLSEAAKRSALRLRRTAITQQDQDAVIDALASLGLGEEAEKMEDRLANAPAAPLSGGAFGGGFGGHGGSSQPGSPERITEMLDDGRHDDAVRLALREVRNLVTSVSNGNSWIIQHGPGEEMLRMIEQRGLTGPIVAAADPGPDARGRRRTDFAGLLQLLGEEERALELYRVAVQERATAASVAALAMSQVRAGDAEAAAATLALCPERELMQLGQTLQQSINKASNDREADVAIAAAEATALWFESAEDPDKLAVGWLSTLWHALTGEQYKRNAANGPALYDRNAWAEVNRGDKTEAEAFEGRLAAHDQLARASLRVPAYAKEGVARLALTAELAGEPLDALIDAVEAAVRTDPRSINPLARQTSFFSGSNQGEIARLVPADERFARWCAGHDADDRVTATAELLRSRRQLDEADRLEGLLVLFSASGSDFLEAAEAISGTRSGRSVVNDGSGTLLAVIDAWSALPVGERPDLSGLLFERLEQNLRSNPDPDTDAEAAFAFADALAKTRGRAAASAAVERFATLWTAPPAERVAFLNKNNPSGGYQHNGPNHRVHVLQRRLPDQYRSQTLGFAALEQSRFFARMTGGSNWGVAMDRGRDEWLEAAFERVAAAEDPVAALIAEVEGGPLLADGDAFRSFVSPTGVGVGSIHRMLPAIREDADKDRPEEAAALAALDGLTAWLRDQPDTLGVVLTRAALADAPLADTLGALAPYRSAIEAMPPMQQAEVAGALPDLRNLPEGLSEEALTFAETLGAIRGDANLRQAQAILDIRSFNRQRNQEYELGEQLPGILLGLTSGGKLDIALDLLAHWKDLLDRSQGSSWRTPEHVLEQLLQDSWEDELPAHQTAIRLGVAAMADARLGLTGSEQLPLSLGRRLQEIWNGEDDGNRQNLRGAAAADRLRSFLEELTVLLDGVNPRPLIPAFLGLRVRGFSDAETLALLEEIAPASSAAEATVPAAVAAGVRLARTARETTSEQQEADRAAVRPALLALAGDGGLPASIRIGFLSEILQNQPELGANGLTAAALALLVETLGDRDAPLDTRAVDGLFDAYAALDPVPEDAPDAATLVTAYIEAIARPRRSGESGLTVRLPSVAEMSANRIAASPRAALLSLELALRHGLHADADRLLAADRGELATCPAAWLSLLRHGRPERAADAIRARFGDARPVTPEGFGFSQDDASRLPELLAFFPENSDAGFRLFAEAALASLPSHSADEPERPFLAPLAGRFDAGLFPSPRLRDMTLLMLAQDPATAVELGPALAEATANASIVSTVSVNNDDEPGWVTRELKLAAVMAALHAGDTEEALAGSEALHEDPGNRNNGQYEFHQQLNALAAITDKARDLGAYDLDRLIALRPLYESLLVPTTFWFGSFYNADERIAAVLVLNALDPDRTPEDFTAWFDATAAPETEGHGPKRRTPRFPVVRGMMKTIAHRDAAPVEDRLRMIRRAFASGIALRHESILGLLVEEDEVLTAAELAEHGEALAEQLGPRGLIGFATALQQMEQPGADAAWDRATAAATEPDDRVLLIERLGLHGQADRAEKLAEGFEPEDARLRHRLEDLRQKRAELEGESEPEGEAAEASPTATP